jgi:hypothetical protein
MRFPRRKLWIALGAAGLAAVALLAVPSIRRALSSLFVRAGGPRSVQDRLDEFTGARSRVRAHFKRAGAAYPPARVVLLGLKEEKRLEVYASGAGSGGFTHIASLPILAASGIAGPKLREGDRQVPEGVYPVELLNPNSRFHVALRIGYPNEFDQRIARQQGRTNLGGDIMIHGGAASIGCLAMGDPAAEDLFVLSAETGIQNVTIILVPFDMRRRAVPPELDSDWRRELYSELRARISELPE